MIPKQDRIKPRTVEDLERMYTFRESKRNAQEAVRVANEAKEAANSAGSNMTAEEIFNRLTNNGQAQGLYRDGDDIYINASYIQMGKIASKNYLSYGYVIINDYVSEIDAGQYYFTLDGKSYTFTLANNLNGQSMRLDFYKQEMILKITAKDGGNVIESVSVTEGERGTEIEPYYKTDFPEAGTRIDLETGEISTPQFKVDENGNAHFSGKFNVNYGKLGDFDLVEGVLRASNEGVVVWLSSNRINFTTQEYDDVDYVSFEAGSYIIAEEYGFDPRKVVISNSRGDSLKVVPNSATLTGAWMATPYTSGEGLSEIVTKQDLIRLGLIS